MTCYTIAIDGPAASGKSSAAERVAEVLGFQRLESGAIYRAITHVLFSERGDFKMDDPQVVEEVLRMDIQIRNKRVSHSGEDITDHLHKAEIDKLVGVVAKELYVRNKTHDIQRDIVRNASDGIVVDGRDIGSVVLPDAFLKIFITAKDETRARRRVKQAGGDFDEVLADIRKRDQHDITREHGPLVVAEDALLIENDNISLEETVQLIVHHFNEKKGASDQ